jgi:hypothetical protein
VVLAPTNWKTLFWTSNQARIPPEFKHIIKGWNKH